MSGLTNMWNSFSVWASSTFGFSGWGIVLFAIFLISAAISLGKRAISAAISLLLFGIALVFVLSVLGII